MVACKKGTSRDEDMPDADGGRGQDEASGRVVGGGDCQDESGARAMGRLDWAVVRVGRMYPGV